MLELKQEVKKLIILFVSSECSPFAVYRIVQFGLTLVPIMV